MPTSGLSWRWPSRFSKRSVRGRVSNPVVGLTSAPALSLCVNSMPPRITEKSYRPRASNRTMVDTRSAHPVWLASRFRNRLESRTGFPSLSMISERSSPSRVCFAAPNGAPWTAPGRSEHPFQLAKGCALDIPKTRTVGAARGSVRGVKLLVSHHTGVAHERFPRASPG